MRAAPAPWRSPTRSRATPTRDVPALTPYLNGPGAKDGPALAAGVYAVYRRHAVGTDAATIAADRTQARTWARAYAVTKGPLVPLVEAWAGFLETRQVGTSGLGLGTGACSSRCECAPSGAHRRCSARVTAA